MIGALSLLSLGLIFAVLYSRFKSAVYGLIILAATWALWQRSLLGRGPVAATALLNLIAAASFTPAAPSLWLVVLLTAATVVAAALPSTSRALHLRRRAEPQQPDEPGK